MDCIDNTRLLRFIDGSLGSAELAGIDEHLDHCQICRELVGSLMQARLATGSSTCHPQWTQPEGLAAASETGDGDGIRQEQRYVMLGLLGQGGMGQVFRARDRYTGQIVALKRVSQTSSAPSRGQLEALTEEFRILSSLRHPYIISVLDYGFDSAQRPFFTMELLESAHQILPAAASASSAVQATLLNQLLQALSYLHRRRILHRDLKPSNILVVQSTSGPAIKLVDFGLSLARSGRQREHAVGTLAYMAPELFCGHAASVQSDLYAVGIIAYELFAGRHPFPIGDKPTELIAQVLHDAPDLAVLPQKLRGVIGKALSKNPRQRQPDAGTLLRELAGALDVPLMGGPLAMRDSHLATAEFTGRATELTQLCQALAIARRGQGSAWLVLGESGVGKSRLLEELRSQALLDGVLVVRGQATPVGSSPYAIWHRLLCILSLHVELSEEEASVLAAVVPEIGQLTEREIQPASELDVQGTRMRMLRIMRAIVRRVARPLLLLLDDLQWAAGDSLELLQQLVLDAAHQPLMIVASLRDDKTQPLSGLLQGIPASGNLRLPPLNQDEIGRLCESMLGAGGNDPDLHALIERETVGNTYLVLEALRALSEEVDSPLMHRPGIEAPRLLVGGIAGLLDRRLARVPADARPLLQLAAVAGRWLDLALLQDECDDLDGLLQLAAEHGILDVHEQRWRFVHDTLRERILQAMDRPLSRELHGRVARKMAAIYADHPAHAAQIAHHYREAQQPSVAAYYFRVAGDHMLAHGAPAAAEALFEQAGMLQQHAPFIEQVRITRGLAQALHALGKLEKADAALRRVCALLDTPLPADWVDYTASMMQSAARFLWAVVGRQLGSSQPGQPPDSIDTSVHKSELLRALTTQEIYVWLARPELALICTIWGISLEASLIASGHRTNFRTALALLLSYTPLHGLGMRYLRRLSARPSTDVSAQVDYLCARAISLTNQGRWAEARTRALQAAALARGQRDSFAYLHCLLQQQLAANGLDDFAEILDLCSEMELLAVQAQNPLFLALALIGQGQAKLRFSQLDLAEERLQRARSLIAQGLGPVLAAIVHGMLAVCAWLQGRQQSAEDLAGESMAALRQIEWPLVDLRYALSCVLEVCLASPEYERHLPIIEEALGRLGRIARSFRFAQPSFFLYRGRHEWAQGRWMQGKRDLQLSLRAARDSGSRYEQAQAHYWLGRLFLERSPSDAAVELKTALALFESLGAVWDAAAVRAAQQPIKG